VTGIVVGPVSAFPDGRGVAVEIEGRRLAVFRLGERVFAIDDRCSHRGFPLHDGTAVATGVRCRTHGACFDLTTGAVVRGPARRAVRAYPAVIVDDQVVVDVHRVPSP
jgi:3-phenylpropionate/trans-cinnamate dioxygenase ferredoxin component